jgi:aspartate/methionine/tyrosine aminotransferase
MNVLPSIECMSHRRRQSSIHGGPGSTYEGPLPEISLARGSPRGWRPPISSFCWSEQNNLAYPPASGLPHLRTAVARYLGARLAMQVEPEDTLVTNGATQAIDVVVSCLKTRRLHRSALTVLFLTPTWMTIPFNQIIEKGGRCLQVPLQFESSGRWILDLDHFDRCLRQRPDAVFLVIPSNCFHCKEFLICLLGMGSRVSLT